MSGGWMGETLAEAAWRHYDEHQARRWDCSMCGFSTTGPLLSRTRSVIQHATSQHPAYLPDRMSTGDMLDLMPALIREAWATIGAPNPDGRPGRGTQRTGWQPPVELWTIDALRPDDGAEAYGSALITRLVECSRLVWEAMDHGTRQAHPQPTGVPTWGAEVAWLRGVWPDAQAWLDACDFAWIESEVKAIQSTLASLVKLRPKPRNLCPDCRSPMHIGEDDWLTCEAGHQHPGPKRLEAQWRRKAPMASRELCEALRIPRGTLRWWAHKGRIKPVRQDGQELYWLPWDAVSLQHPDIVAAIDSREVA